MTGVMRVLVHHGRRVPAELARCGVLLPLLCASLAAQAGEGLGASPEARLASADRRIAEVETLLVAAHFKTALGVAQETRGLLDAAAGAPGVGQRRARLEVLEATAEIALGRRDAARRSLERALRADPALELDEREVSPKLLSVWREVRREASPPVPAEGAP